MPAFNNSSVNGAGYNSNKPYLSSQDAPKITPGGNSLNSVFNVPKYGSGGGLGGGIGGMGSGIGSYGSMGGSGIGAGGYLNPTGSAGSVNKPGETEENEFGGRY